MSVFQFKNGLPESPGRLIVILTAVLLLPFSFKAINIDDPLFIWTANHLLKAPLDFYGFSVNWGESVLPMYEVTKNPPLVAYYIALVGALFGTEAPVLHFAFLPLALLTAYGIYSLSRRLTNNPFLAALLCILAPAFLVSATSVMAEIPLLCLYVWAIYFWLDGLDRQNRLRLWLSALLMTLAVFAKYFGISLVPLLFAYTLARNRRIGPWALYLLVPTAALLGFQYLSRSMYGYGLLSGAAQFAAFGSSSGYSSVLNRIMTGLSFTGGAMIGILFFAPVLWARRHLVIGLAGLFFFFLAQMIPGSPFAFELATGKLSPALALQSSVFVLSGVHVLLLALRDLKTRKDPESLLLFLWIFGTFFFATFVNWSVNVRIILPAIPAAGMLVARNLIEKASSPLQLPRLHLALLVPAAVAGLSVSAADYSLASCQRSAVASIARTFRGYSNTLWFQGHWGFQYYMQAAGAKPLDFRGTNLSTGDIVVIPGNNTNTTPLPKSEYHLLAVYREYPFPPVGIMTASLGAGYHAHRRGPLPYAVGRVPPEEYSIYLAGRFANPAAIVRRFQEQMGLETDETR